MRPLDSSSGIVIAGQVDFSGGVQPVISSINTTVAWLLKNQR